MSKRSAFTLTEVLVALAVVAAALLPIVTLSSTSTRKTSFTEYHVFFQARAVRLLEHFSVYDYERLKELSLGRSDGRIDVRLQDPPVPAEFRRKLRYSMERLYFVELAPGLGKLTATMAWASPLDDDTDPSASGHRLKLVRFVSDGRFSLKTRAELPL